MACAVGFYTRDPQGFRVGDSGLLASFPWQPRWVLRKKLLDDFARNHARQNSSADIASADGELNAL